MSKIMFIDIDGVIVRYKQLREQKRLVGDFHHFDKDYLARLNEIITKSGAEVVLSSSWRIYGLDRFNKHAKKEGLVKLPFDITPSPEVKTESGLYMARTRGMEIKAWLEKHPEVEKYIMIDDSSDMEDLIDRLVYIENGMETGLQDEHVKLALKMLE